MVATALAVGTGSAAGATAPVLTVTPSTDLVDGQTVTVDGSGFPPTDPVTWPFPNRDVEVCHHEALAQGYPDPYGCGQPTPVSIHDDGTFTTTLVVNREVRSQTGDSFRCDEAPGECRVIEVAYGGRGYRLEASTPISFRSK
jgi:hypothetical protein